jgi:hypothetical protein
MERQESEEIVVTIATQQLGGEMLKISPGFFTGFVRFSLRFLCAFAPLR